jgi:asparagine synthase (glutamine-hydrolysing)
MCGIGGIFSNSSIEGSLQKTEAITKALHHRGPDGNGSFAHNNCLLVHTRLSIIDTSASGAQPFYNEDKTIVAVINGELYNFAPLKEQLIKKGHIFIGNSDCEIVPHLYEEYGEGLFEKLEGMFAIALFDTKQNKLLLARDRFGIKPLYYTHQQNTLYFGSELKAILCHPEIKALPDWQAIHDFMSLCYVPEPATGFEHINALAPAHYLIKTAHTFNTVRYADVFASSGDSSGHTFETCSNGVEKLLQQSVGSYMVADVPLGAFLSGGIDSSVVVKTMKAFAGNQEVKTFTAKFNDSAFDESKQAAEISAILNTQHHELLIDETECTPALMEEVLSHFDQPFADSSALPTYLISKKIRSHVKVALSGDGGDEIFAGYSLFWYMDYIEKIDRFPVLLRKCVRSLLQFIQPLFPEQTRQFIKLINLSLSTTQERLFRLSAYLSEQDKQDLYTPAFAAKVKKEAQPTSRLFAVKPASADKKYRSISEVLFRNSLLSDMFKKVDMMSMKAAIEVRVPLMQEQLVNTGINLPDQYKIKDRRGKQTLRYILKKELPASIVDSPKSGFAIPLDSIVTPEMSAYIREKLCSEHSRINALITPEKTALWVEQFLSKERNKTQMSREGLYQRIFMLLAIETWMRKYNLSLS